MGWGGVSILLPQACPPGSNPQRRDKSLMNNSLSNAGGVEPAGCLGASLPGTAVAENHFRGRGASGAGGECGGPAGGPAGLGAGRSGSGGGSGVRAGGALRSRRLCSAGFRLSARGQSNFSAALRKLLAEGT